MIVLIAVLLVVIAALVPAVLMWAFAILFGVFFSFVVGGNYNGISK